MRLYAEGETYASGPNKGQKIVAPIVEAFERETGRSGYNHNQINTIYVDINRRRAAGNVDKGVFTASEVCYCVLLFPTSNGQSLASFARTHLSLPSLTTSQAQVIGEYVDERRLEAGGSLDGLSLSGCLFWTPLVDAGRINRSPKQCGKYFNSNLNRLAYNLKRKKYK